MNLTRRQFLSAAGSALALAATAEIIIPKRSIFLPPRRGWPLQMREVQQYLINDDALVMRWDVAFEGTDGKREQYWLQGPEMTGLQLVNIDPNRYIEESREMARAFFETKIPIRARPVRLPLPSSAHIARYV